jgi:hypothetical protein
VIFYRSPSMSALEEALGAEDCFLKESIRQF